MATTARTTPARPLRARATDAIPVTPVAVTDRTCAALIGLEGRAFRALVEKLEIRHVAAGRRLIVLVKDLEAALERAAVNDAPGETTADEPDEPQDADAILAKLGRRTA